MNGHVTQDINAADLMLEFFFTSAAHREREVLSLATEDFGITPWSADPARPLPRRRGVTVFADRRRLAALASTWQCSTSRMVLVAAVPRTQYTKSGDVQIAYQVVGEGPPDLVFVPGWVSNVDEAWDNLLLQPLLERLSSFCRMVLFDKRGTGASERDVGAPTLEERMDDVGAVMDAAGLHNAALFGPSEGGPMSILFAATYPERVTALVLYGTGARGRGSPEYVCGYGWERVLLELGRIAEHEWGQGRSLAVFASELAEVPRMRQMWGRWERLGASPRGAKQLTEMVLDIDVRPILETLQVPTLVVHHTGDRVPVESGRYLASHIPRARYWEQPGEHLFGDVDALVGEIEEFLTGARPARVRDRLLATVLLTDMVSSTERTADLGDRAFGELLERFRAVVRDQLQNYRGREISTRGDNFLATFDGPARAIRCAIAAGDAARTLGVDVRSGLHTGEIELMNGDIGGIAVNICARVSALAGAGEVLASRTVVDLVAGSGLEFDDRGEHELKGVPGAWRLFAAKV
jgi:pimeloyl-ACP methyl ester carboxylesterase/class 3 adenylate cyclase